MNPARRLFLERSVGVAASALLPGWLAACQRAAGQRQQQGQDPGRVAADGSNAATEDAVEPRAALERARALGRPLLLLVVPESDLDRWNRAELFGVWLQHVGGVAAAELVTCELGCATSEELRALAPAVATTAATLAVLIEPGGRGALAVDGPPTELPNWGDIERNGVPYEEIETRTAAAQREVAAAFEARLRTLLVPDDATLSARAATEVAALARREPPLPSLAADAAVGPAHAELAPLWLLQRIRASDAAERAALLLLAEQEVTRRWREVPPPRMRWARGEGCGTEVEYLEGDPELAEGGLSIACGMGMVPEYSARFLTFYVQRVEGS